MNRLMLELSLMTEPIYAQFEQSASGDVEKPACKTGSCRGDYWEMLTIRQASMIAAKAARLGGVVEGGRLTRAMVVDAAIRPASHHRPLIAEIRAMP